MQAKFLDRTTFDFENSAIIRPPFEEPTNKEVSHKYTRIIIDSRDRDVSQYPTPTKYWIPLEQDIEDVKTGEIILMDIPMSGYIVNAYNNVITTELGSVYIPVGNYDAPGLAVAIQEILRPWYPSNTCVYNPVIDKFTFNYNIQASFTLIFAAKDKIATATARLLGFNPGTSCTIPCTSPNRINLNVNNYIVMSIDMFSINASSNSVIDRTTALVHSKAMLLNFWSVNNTIKKYFNPIIGRVDRLKVSFVDYYGNPYDFNNVDHRIEILLESRKNLGRYSHFV